MAIYHCHCKVISRGQGRSAVGAAAYRSGERLTNDYDGITHDYTNKGGVVYSEVMLCENAPQEYQNRAVLWNEVERQEKGGKARLAREYEVALPIELNRDEQIELVRDYVRENFVKNGMCADFAVHDKGDGNPHAHIMLTTRPIEPGGEWGAKQKKEYLLDKDGNKQYDPKKKTYKCRTVKVNDWDTTEFLQRSRENWAAIVNRELEKKNLPQRVDHRSLKEQGKQRIPTEHIGVAAKNMEKRGKVSERGERNREITAANRQLLAVAKAHNQVVREINAIREDMAWSKVHEGISGLDKQLHFAEQDGAKLRLIQERLSAMSDNLQRQKPSKASEGRTVVYEKQEIPYFVYHQQKALADVCDLQDRVSRYLSVIESQRQEPEQKPAPTAYERLQAKQEAIKKEMPGRGAGEPEQRQAVSPAFDVAGTARQLAAHRAAFVTATIQSRERTSYQENPIYRQQAAQITDLVKREKEQGESIRALQAEKDKLGLFKGKEKKAIQQKLDNFYRLHGDTIDKLKEFGITDPAQADTVIREKTALAAQEQAKVKAARANIGAADRAAEAKTAFLDLARKVPPEQRQAVEREMSKCVAADEPGQTTLARFEAEVEARRQLDTALKPEQAQERTHQRTHDRGRDRDR
jgi:hypothetical protein